MSQKLELDKARFKVLDSFRGVFAMCVVVFHMHILHSFTQLNFFRNSYIFVDFFFALSGFVLAHGYAFKQKKNFPSFVTARAFRLFPLHLVMLVVFIIFEIFKLISIKYGMAFNKVPFVGANDITQIIPNILLLQSWTVYTYPSSFNTPSWSVSVEFYMYIIFYVTLLQNKYFKYFSWVFIFVLSVVICITHNDIILKEVIRGLSCFYAGLLTYLIYKYFYNKIKFDILIFTYLEILALFIVVVFVSFELQYKSLLSILVFCITILIFSFEKGALSDLFKKRIPVFVGTLSYSIYMTHTAVIFIFVSIAMLLQKMSGLKYAPMIQGVRTLDFGGVITNNIIGIIYIFFVLLVSIITYNFIEKRGQEFGKMLNNKYFILN